MNLKVGDKVKVLDNCEQYKYHSGTITNIREDGVVLVKLDIYEYLEHSYLPCQLLKWSPKNILLYNLSNKYM